jgi:uncharacterized protein (UPF0305 family)
MVKINGEALMFTQGDVDTNYTTLPRILREIFVSENITNNEYIRRYEKYLKDQIPDMSEKRIFQKIASDRKFLQDKHNLSLKFFENILKAMGLTVTFNGPMTSASVEVRTHPIQTKLGTYPDETKIYTYTEYCPVNDMYQELERKVIDILSDIKKTQTGVEIDYRRFSALQTVAKKLSTIKRYSKK